MRSLAKHFALRASAGRRSRRTWGLGLERFSGTLERVPKLRKRFLEREQGVSRNAAGVLLRVSRQFDSLPLCTAAFIEPIDAPSSGYWAPTYRHDIHDRSASRGKHLSRRAREERGCES